ncbi:hypothetical protein [Pedobacter sp. NJ-S-72]
MAKIPQSDTKPHYALDENKKWWVYFRVNDKSILASKIIVDVLKKENTHSGQLINYTDQEQKLLKYLDEEGQITLKQFSKLTKSSNQKAQKILVSFILADLIQPHTSEKEEYFYHDNAQIGVPLKVNPICYVQFLLRKIQALLFR